MHLNCTKRKKRAKMYQYFRENEKRYKNVRTFKIREH